MEGSNDFRPLVHPPRDRPHGVIWLQFALKLFFGGLKSMYLDAKSCLLSLSNEYLAIMRLSKIRRKPLYEIRLFNRKRQFFQNATCRVAFLVSISLAFCHASLCLQTFRKWIIMSPFSVKGSLKKSCFQERRLLSF